MKLTRTTSAGHLAMSHALTIVSPVRPSSRKLADGPLQHGGPRPCGSSSGVCGPMCRSLAAIVWSRVRAKIAVVSQSPAHEPVSFSNARAPLLSTRRLHEREECSLERDGRQTLKRSPNGRWTSLATALATFWRRASRPSPHRRRLPPRLRVPGARERPLRPGRPSASPAQG